MDKHIKTQIYCEKNNIPYPERRFDFGEGIFFMNGEEKIYEKDFNLDEKSDEYKLRLTQLKKEKKIERLRDIPTYKYLKKIMTKLNIVDEDLLSDDEPLKD